MEEDETIQTNDEQVTGVRGNGKKKRAKEDNRLVNFDGMGCLSNLFHIDFWMKYSGINRTDIEITLDRAHVRRVCVFETGLRQSVTSFVPP